MPEYGPKKENQQEPTEHGFFNTWIGNEVKHFWRIFAKQADELIFNTPEISKRRQELLGRREQKTREPNELVDALTRLGDLKERGFLTDQEFKDAKAELLHPKKRDQD